jgi:hypothetical protein
VAASSPTNGPVAREKTDAFIAPCELQPLGKWENVAAPPIVPRGHSMDSAGLNEPPFADTLSA